MSDHTQAVIVKLFKIFRALLLVRNGGKHMKTVGYIHVHLIVLLTTFFVPLCAHANPFSISGTVYDDEDQSQSNTAGDTAISGVTIVLYDVSNDVCQSTSTDADGDYAFDLLPAGDYRIYEAAGEVVGSLTACPPSESTADIATKAVTHGTIQDPDQYISTTSNRIDLTLSANATNQDFGDYLIGPEQACEGTAFLFQRDPTQVYEVNLITGTAVNTGAVLSNPSSSVNGFGYNVLTGYFYGASDANEYRVGIVSGDWNNVHLDCLNCGNGTTNFNAGDVTLDGYLVQWHSGANRRLCWFDVNPQRTTYMHRVNPVTKEADSGCINGLNGSKLGADLGINPINNTVYTIANSNGRLYEVDIVTGVFTDTGISAPRCGYGAQYFDGDGFFYIACNSGAVGGNIYRIDIRDPNNIGEPIHFANGPQSSINDGGRCALAPSATLDYGDAPDSYDTTLINFGPRHIATNELYLGSGVDTEEDAAPNANADGDDLDGSDTDDSLVTPLPEHLEGGSVYEVEVDVVNQTGSQAYVVAYIDWDQDGLFTDNGSQSDTTTVNADGRYTVRWSAVPSSALGGNTYIRIRLSSDQTAIESHDGPAVDGEVEDILIDLGLTDCRLDGQREGVELCDDGNLNNCDTCTNACKIGPNVQVKEITGGTFEMGHSRMRSARPARTVTVGDFQAGKTEVTVAQFRACVDAGVCQVPVLRRPYGCKYTDQPGANENMPMNCLPWNYAARYGEWCTEDDVALPAAGLLTEAQWEYLAKNGDDQTTYPTGNTAPSYDEAVYGFSRAYGTRDVEEVCSRGTHNENGLMTQTTFGLCDLTGNVMEWVQDNYSRYNANLPTDGTAVVITRGRYQYYSPIRGGSFYSRRSTYLQSSYRTPAQRRTARRDIGFRIGCLVSNGVGCFGATDPAYLGQIPSCQAHDGVGPYPLDCYCDYVASTAPEVMPSECN